MKSEWLVLTSASDSYKRIFVKKDDIERVSTTTIDGTNKTVIVASIRGRTRAFSVLEPAKQIFQWM